MPTILEIKAMNSLLKRLRAKRDEKGFSLIDVVITVAVIVALSVGGFVTYNGIVDNAKQGAVDYAASNTYKAALAYESDGNDDTSACSAIDEYNTSSTGIDVQLMVPKDENATTDADYLYYPAVAGQDSYTC